MGFHPPHQAANLYHPYHPPPPDHITEISAISVLWKCSSFFSLCSLDISFFSRLFFSMKISFHFSFLLQLSFFLQPIFPILCGKHSNNCKEKNLVHMHKLMKENISVYIKRNFEAKSECKKEEDWVRSSHLSLSLSLWTSSYVSYIKLTCSSSRPHHRIWICSNFLLLYKVQKIDILYVNWTIPIGTI